MSRALPAFLFLLPALTGCSSLVYQPSRDTYGDPARAGVAYEDVGFAASDGVKLHAWFFPAAGVSRGLVVQFHGNAQNLTAHSAVLYPLVKEGYDLLAFDYRGYGKSEGEPSQEGLNRDALAAIEYALKRRPGGPLVLYGQSLGGAVLLRAYADAGERARERVRAVVVEGAFHSYRAIARDLLSRNVFTWLFQPLGSLLVSDEYSPEEAIPKVSPTRLIVIHGEGDDVIPAEFGKKIFELAREPKQLWLVPGGSHIDAMSIGGGAVRRRLVDLLGR
jgi:hypothetical protein